MARTDSAGAHLCPRAIVHRQRFYFLRHGQSVNNLHSLQDDADKSSEASYLQEQQPMANPRQQLVCQLQDEKQHRHKQRQRPPYFKGCGRQQLHQHTLQHKQLQPCSHYEHMHLQSVRPKYYQRSLHQFQDCKEHPRAQRQKRCASKLEGELPAADACFEAHGSGLPTRRVSDPSLTQVGRRQAAAAARWVQHHVQEMLLRPQTSKRRRQQGVQQATQDLPSPSIKKIVCSPMRRAVETAAELKKVLRVEVYVHPLLFEQGGLFTGPREAGPPLAAGSSSATTAAAPGGGNLADASYDGEALELAGTDGSQTSDSGGSTIVLPEARSTKFIQSREIMIPPNAESACRGESYEGLTLQEIKSILPGVKVITPSQQYSSFKLQFGARRGDNDKHATFTAASSQEKLASGTKEMCRTPEAGARVAQTDESRLVVRRVHRAEAAKAEVVGGHYCEEWTRGGRSWWCGGREKLIDTVARAAEIVSWMQSECRVAQDTGGSVLMVMHGLMMDLIVKSLMFPFPSASSACPYLDLLAQSLHAHEAASGKPFYNMPQQAAYFMSSNCSFCCFELAAVAQQQPVYLSDPSPRPACVYYGVTAPVHAEDCQGNKSSTEGDVGDTAESEGSRAAFLLCGGVQLRKRQTQQEQSIPCTQTAGDIAVPSSYMSITGSAKSCLPDESARFEATGEAGDCKDIIRRLQTSTVIKLGDPPTLVGSSKEASHGNHSEEFGCSGENTVDLCVVLSSTRRGDDKARASALTSISPGAVASFTERATPAPALVSALTEWNVLALDPQLYSGQTLGSSILMSC